MTSRLRSGPRRNRRIAAALIAGITATVVAGSPAPAGAQAVPDASCPGPPDTFAHVLGQFRHAQTFTAQNTGALTMVALRVEKAGSPGDWVVSVNAVDDFGIPINVVLASTTVPNGSVPNGLSTLTANFASPADVTAGQNYAVVVTRPDSDDLGTGYRTTDVCPGDAFISDNQTGGFTQQCTGALRCDLVLAVFVEPTPESQPEPAPKADGTLTIDANKGKVEKGRKVTLTGQLDVAANESCEQNRQIQIQRRLKAQDDSKFQTFTNVQTDAAGNYSLKTKVKKTYFYRAIVGETDACDDEVSSSQKVRVQKKKAAQEA